MASYLNAFVRHANIVKMANMAQLVNPLAPIYTTPARMWYQTIFILCLCFRTIVLENRFKLMLMVLLIHFDGKDIPYLMYHLLMIQQKKVIINVVNRNKERI